MRNVEPSKLLQVSLIYANNTEEDILLKDQLDRYAAEHPNFKVGVLTFSSVVILPSFSYWQRDGSSCSGRECADSPGRCLARRGAFCRAEQANCSLSEFSHRGGVRQFFEPPCNGWSFFRCQVFYVVAKPKHKASWKGGVGFVSKEQVQQYLPKPADDSLIMVRTLALLVVRQTTGPAVHFICSFLVVEYGKRT